MVLFQSGFAVCFPSLPSYLAEKEHDCIWKCLLSQKFCWDPRSALWYGQGVLLLMSHT